MFLAKIATAAPLEQYGDILRFSFVFYFTLEYMVIAGVLWAEFFPSLELETVDENMSLRRRST